MEKQKKQRKFLAVPVSDTEMELVERLIVEIAKRDERVFSRADLIRKGLNHISEQAGGQKSFVHE